jgi:nicotinic acid mononucleotide adenylyltransferase
MSKRIRACYPGTFNPATVAHLAVAEAACQQLVIDEFVFVLTTHTLGKNDNEMSSAEYRAEALRSLTIRPATPPSPEWSVHITKHSLLTDLSQGFDWLIMGADKWHQINELRWYNKDAAQRDVAVAALPPVAIAPRPPFEIPRHLTRLVIADAHQHVSSTAVRAGRSEWEAR